MPSSTMPNGSVAVPVDRPSRGELGCAAGTGLVLLAFTVGAVCFALGLLRPDAAAVHRILAGVAAVAVAGLLAAVVSGTVRGSRGNTLTVGEAGIDLAGRHGSHSVAWSDIAEAAVTDPEGPKRARSGSPTLRLRPREPEWFTTHSGLRERLTVPAHEAGTEPVFWLTFPLPVTATDEMRAAVRNFGPPAPEDSPDS